MNVIIPPKRRDKKTSFRKLVEYVSTREENKNAEQVKPEPAHTPDAGHTATPGFGQLVDYVGRKNVSPVSEIISISPEGIQRVLSGEVLCETNCFSLEAAASEMNMTAMQNRHCKDAVYHFILSWQSDENPSPDAVFTSVRYSMAQLGMADHQYVAAIHKDTDNVHCHVSANRVHPVTFRAQNMWNDADTLQKACRVLERDLGFNVDNGSWEMSEDGSLYRTRRALPSAPRGAAKREIFSDKESLHGYAVRETRQMISDLSEEGSLSWPLLHNVMYTRGLGVREQNGGLAVFDLLNPDSISVKASDIHPAIGLQAMEAKHGAFLPAPPASDPENHEAGMLMVNKFYLPQLHVRDGEARRERREARAVARDILRARYDAYRAGWERPDLRAGERFRQISAHCVATKANVRQAVRDPLMRRLMYRVAEFEKMKAAAELRLQLREERQVLKETGQARPLTWKSWVEQEALNGDVAAISQMRGWAYREKRAARKAQQNHPAPDAIVHVGPGDDAPIVRSPVHDVRLNKDGSIEYQRNGITEVADRGDRVEVYPRNEADQETWWLAAAVTAQRSGENAVIKGDEAAVMRLLDSGAVLNANNAVHRFEVGDSTQQARIAVTESWFREQYSKGAVAQDPVPRYDRYEPEEAPVRNNRDLPRP